MTATCRAATLDDALPIAEVHVATWRACYAGIVPQDHLDGLSAERRAEMWRRHFSAGVPARQHLWVAEDAGRVVGFSNGGPCRDEDAQGLGELRAIYVLPSHWDSGVGRTLHDLTIGSLREAGFPAATLWVLEANGRAREFYRRRGWAEDGTRKVVRIGADLVEVRYRHPLTS